MDFQTKRHLQKKNFLSAILLALEFFHAIYFSDTPLLYRAVPSWFMRVEQMRDTLLARNDETYWVPEAIREGRFANWLKDARDWNISRSR